MTYYPAPPHKKRISYSPPAGIYSRPFLSVKAHKSVSDNRWLNLLIGIIVPAGLLIWLNIWRYRVRLDKDLKTIVKNNCDIQERIKTTF